MFAKCVSPSKVSLDYVLLLGTPKLKNIQLFLVKVVLSARLRNSADKDAHPTLLLDNLFVGNPLNAIRNLSLVGALFV